VTAMSVKQMVADARTRITELSVDEVRAERERGGIVLVDLRDVRERWREGSIPGARHVPRGMLEFWADPASDYHKAFMDPGARTIVFCNLGHRSALSADTLQRLGYANVAHLDGGFTAWRDAGGDVEPIEKK
jgi:rhodanese-related sulfurtransferase